MELTLGNFKYFSICVEGLLFGTTSVLPLITKLLKQSDNGTSQEFILAYLLCIYNTALPEKTVKGITSFSMLSVFCIFYLCLSSFSISSIF